MTVSGYVGFVYVGYKVALKLGSWQFQRDDTLENTSTGVAKLTKSDDLWSLHKPTSIVLRLGSSWWIWSDPVITIEEGQNVKFNISGDPRVEEGRTRYGSESIH